MFLGIVFFASVKWFISNDWSKSNEKHSKKQFFYDKLNIRDDASRTSVPSLFPQPVNKTAAFKLVRSFSLGFVDELKNLFYEF